MLVQFLTQKTCQDAAGHIRCVRILCQILCVHITVADTMSLALSQTMSLAHLTNEPILSVGGEDVLIDSADFEEFSKVKWTLWSGYAVHPKVGRMHRLVIGARPDGIPEDYVVDHIDRNKRNNRRANLRWVSTSFNTWNIIVKSSKRSQFKGVTWDKAGNCWSTSFCKRQQGRYRDEREAALAVAKAAIKKWPKWAPTSDLLIGPGLLTWEEILVIQDELASDTTWDGPAKRKELPQGVSVVRLAKGLRYRARYKNKTIGMYLTVAEAVKAYTTHVQHLRDAKWGAHLKLPVTRDEEGRAVINLTGNVGKGQRAVVDEEYWHGLTFETAWNSKYVCGSHYPRSTNQVLHALVFRLANPDVATGVINSIDHKNGDTLDNRAANLRVATSSVQGHNKRKRAGCTSQYFGVSLDPKSRKWRAIVTHKKKSRNLGFYAVEEDAARAYDRGATETYGEHAQLNFPVDVVAVSA